MQRMPDWVKFVLAGIIPLMGGAVAYGKLQGNHDALVDRLNRVEQQASSDRSHSENVVTGIQDSLGKVQLDLARVCVKLNAGCKE